MIITKICTKCGKEKELSEFYKQKRGKYGCLSYCKECRNKQVCEYRNNNKEKLQKIECEYRNNNKERKSETSKQWYEINKKHRLKTSKQWRENNKKRTSDIIRQWQLNNPEKYNIICKRKNNKRKRNLGYNPLNIKFEGSVGHHINNNDVVYIPREIHKSIPHSQDNLESMEIINDIAIEYIGGRLL